MSYKAGDASQAPATTSLLAATTTEPKDWVLALSAPYDAAAAAATDSKNSAPRDGGDAMLEQPRPHRPCGDSAGSFTGAASSSSLPLEERITVAQLQIIMEGFNSDAATPSDGAFFNSVESRSTASPSEQLASTRRGRLPGAEKKKKKEASPTTEQLHQEAGAPAFKDPSPSTSPKRHPSPEESPPMLSLLKMNKKARYDRRIPQEAFVELIHRVLPNATTEEVIELMKKVDYDGQGVVTWQELSTFFASQNRRRAYLSNVKLQYNESPQPATCAPPLLHTQITCYTVSPNKKLLLTGGTDGVVHAWGMNALTYRGLIFSIDDWIIGLHYHHKGRFIYVVTMDRAVYIVDANSFEVTRMYRGRAMGDSSERLLFAERTTRTVKVGGTTTSRRGVPPSTSNKPIYTTNVNATAAGGSGAKTFQYDQLQKQLATSPSAVLTTGLAMQSLSRADASRLTSPGSGPYVERTVEEGVLVGLVDPIMSSLYHNTTLDEDVLLLGTSTGSVYLFVLPSNVLKTVLSPKRTLRLHTDAVHKMDFYFPLYALVSCSEDGTVKMTSMVTGQTLHQFAGPSGGDKGNKMLFRSAAAGDGTSAATSCEDGHAAVRDFAIHPRLKLLVTVGPERNGLVWDFAQEKPVAALDAHNAPCRCCAVSHTMDEIITVDTDGVFQSFDCNGFHTIQKINFDAVHHPFLFLEPENAQRLLFFGRYPFHLRAKRQDSDDCPASYTGHYGAMFDALYSRTFSHIITVDADALAMTWDTSGKNVFSFVLKDFSDSATMNAARLTCVALDGLQRRVITGFNNGAVVVWNAANGQPINFLSAAVSGGAGGPTSTGGLDGAMVDSAALEKEKVELQRRPWRANNNNLKSGGSSGSAFQTASGSAGDDTDTAGGAAAAGDGMGNLTNDVTAVGSLVRRGATFFVFACRQYLYTVRESSDFTVASAAKWLVPDVYGTINTITQMGEHLVACGTSTGAIVCYHVLSERQDGAPLFVKDLGATNALLGNLAQAAGATTNGRRGGRPVNSGGTGTLRGRHLSASQSLMNASMTLFSSQVGSGTGGNARGGPGGPGGPAPHITSGVIRILHLPVVNEHLFLSLHADGTMAFWQSFRRLNVGTVFLGAAGVAEGVEEGSSMTGFVAEVDSRNRFLVFADEEANVHICSLHFITLNQRQEAEALQLANPATYTMWRDEQAELNEGLPLANTLTSVNTSLEEPTPAEGEEGGEKEAPTKHEQATEPAQEAKRTVCVPDVFKRVYAFGTGLGTIVRILLIDPHPPHMARSPGKCTGDTKETEDTDTKKESEEDADPSYRPMIICVGANRYTRAFNFNGEMIGDFGTTTWSLDDFALENYNVNTQGGLCSGGERRRFPCFIAKTDDHELSTSGMPDTHEYDFDYLQDALVVQQLNSFNARKPRSKPSNRCSSLGSTLPLSNSTMQFNNTLPPTTPHKGNGGEAVPLADALRTLTTSGGAHLDDGNANKNADEENSAEGYTNNMSHNNNNNNNSTVAAAEPSQISTVIKQSTRHRYVNEPKYKGIIKKDFAAQIRQKAAMELVQEGAKDRNDAAMAVGGAAAKQNPFADPMEDTTDSALLGDGLGARNRDDHASTDVQPLAPRLLSPDISGPHGPHHAGVASLMRFDVVAGADPPMDLKSPSTISSPSSSDISITDPVRTTAEEQAPPRRASTCDGYTNPLTNGAPPTGPHNSSDNKHNSSSAAARQLKTNSPPPKFTRSSPTEAQQSLPSLKTGTNDTGASPNADGTLPLVLKRPQREASFLNAIRRISTTAGTDNPTSAPARAPTSGGLGGSNVGASFRRAAKGAASGGNNNNSFGMAAGGGASGGGKKGGTVHVRESKEETPEALIQQSLSLFREKLMKDLKDNEQFNAENSNTTTTNNNKNANNGGAAARGVGAGTAPGGSNMQEKVRLVLSGKRKATTRANVHSSTNFLGPAQNKDNRSYLEKMYVAPVDTAPSLSIEKRIQPVGKAPADEKKPPQDV